MNTLLVARREIAALFRTPTGYLIAAVALMLDALQLNAVAIGNDRRPSAVVLQIFLLNAAFVTEAVAVLLSMRLLVADAAAPMILGAPLREREVVLGKWLAAFGFLSIVTLVSLYLPALIFVHGKVSLGHIAAGYLGLLLVGGATLAIGSAAAASTRHLMVAPVITGAIVGLLELSFYVAKITEGPWREQLGALAPVWNHHESFRSGILQLSDIVFFVTLTYVGLAVATRVLARRRGA